MIYGGFKHTIDMCRMVTDQTILPEDKRNAIRWVSNNRNPVLPEWVFDLQWEDRQILPSPFKEITQDEWYLLGICGHESIGETFYGGFNIPNELAWFGGWSCHVYLYGTYGLIDAHMHGHPDDIELGKGHRIRQDKYTTYTVRYFRIGCEHSWQEVIAESRMCYHVYRCIKCNMKRSVDSSD